ncbi:hypothetical protein [uncultured Tenacibaculum sp.]|uniref:hypothetical protein n=1 Tax=uncultured Tenacibaculum sp. TaxID=174713 RepID=UPI00260C77BB|nr:hypothetical protein [uncultured Tenacibaculum sp.]
MKKIFRLFIVTLITINSYSQSSEKEFQKIKNEITKDFSTIKSDSFNELIPFEINSKWGYLNSKTKEIIIPPKYGKLNFFNPTMEGYYKGESFTVRKNGVINFEGDKPEKESYIMEVDESEDTSNIKIISSSDGYKGFKIDENGNLLNYSDIYYNSEEHSWNIRPFQFKGKYFAIVKNKNGKYGVIDKSGKTLKGFNFKYKEISLNKFAKDKEKLWFFVQENNDMWSLKSNKNKTKFKNKLMANPITSSHLFGFSSIENKDKQGIFDCYNLKWKIKPQKEKIGGLYYSSDTKLDKNNPLDRKKAKIYYSFSYKDGFEEYSYTTYFINLKKEKFKPKVK